MQKYSAFVPEAQPGALSLDPTLGIPYPHHPHQEFMDPPPSMSARTKIKVSLMQCRPVFAVKQNYRTCCWEVCLRLF